MKLITKQDRINSVPERWLKQYPIKIWGGGEKADIYKKLIDVKGNCSEQDICEIIGNNSWTVLRCSSCASEVEFIVEVPVCWDDDSIELCEKCLSTAIGLIKG